MAIAASPLLSSDDLDALPIDPRYSSRKPAALAACDGPLLARTWADDPAIDYIGRWDNTQTARWCVAVRCFCILSLYLIADSLNDALFDHGGGTRLDAILSYVVYSEPHTAFARRQQGRIQPSFPLRWPSALPRAGQEDSSE